MTKSYTHYFAFLIAFIAVILIALTFVQQTSIIPVNTEALVKNMTVAISALPLIVLIYASALGYNRLFSFLLSKLRLHTTNTISIPFTLQIVTGLGFIALTTYILAAFGLLTQSIAYIFLIVGVIPLLFKRPAKPKIPNYLALLSAPAIGALLVAATCPPGTLWQIEAFGYDVTSYHLQIPNEWLQNGQMSGLTHNVYSFLPSLGESLYYLVGTLNNSVITSIYTIQLFHASFAILTAALLATAIRPYTGRMYALIATAIFITTPWVLITASLAYNEMFMTAFGSAAFALVLRQPLSHQYHKSTLLAIGFFLGLATLAKPTAGFFFAIPIGLIILIPYLHPRFAKNNGQTKICLKSASIVAITGILTLSPYLIRNTIWTGNPVFPFATATFGQAHWGTVSDNSPDLNERWERGHSLAMSSDSYLTALNRQFITNRGYGSWSGTPTPPEKNNIARFTVENGVPLLTILLFAACILSLSSSQTRRPAITLLLLLLCQFLFWSLGTHLQSRFLIPTLIPISLIIALGFSRLHRITYHRMAYIAPLTASIVILMLFATQAMTLWSQTTKVKDETGRMVKVPPYYITGYYDFTSINSELYPNHVLNNLPSDSHVLLIADNASLLFIKPEITYNTAFDINPLGELMRKYNNDPIQITSALKSQGITHIYVHHPEIKRLQETYGFDPAVNEQSITKVAQQAKWTIVTNTPIYTLYKIQ
ncbi:hypothetical protein KS4_17570 [Poriferisphaera corsica]|uniref:Uncharacterized protein n=1 Tax=Poriferisphaera corsica TaxID=2528020 RepID=A0A517YTZ8_9BACT|nr:glycosyltransferase family 39 protein [Poriferisphaera corsica]QDU33701.1 hypothetical protein KS4_17570 [Poriferisphaera corsica]